jgi:hypothetical protein
MSSSRVFEMPEHWEPVPELHERIGDLVGDRRYRTAMTELLDLLRQDPSNVEATIQAIRVAYTSRTDLIKAKEPLTPDQRSSAVLAPIATQCSLCDTFWYSIHLLMAFEHLGVTGARGAQCPICRYTLCEECAAVAPHRGAALPCATPGCAGELKIRVLPTGRRGVLSIDPGRTERVIVVRDGPIPPAIGEALSTVTRWIPLVPDDAPFILICRSVPGLMAEEASCQFMAWQLVDMLEKDIILAPGAWGRSTSMRVHGTEDDTDYLIIIVELPDKAPNSASHAFGVDLMTEHLQRVADENPGQVGRCWAGLNSGSIIDEAAAIILQTTEDARKLNHLATRMRILSKYIMVTTAIPTLDLQQARSCFENGYLTYIERLYENFRFPGYGMSFVHWISCSDGLTTQLHLTFLPADSSELAMLAQDLLDPAERQNLGL